MSSMFCPLERAVLISHNQKIKFLDYSYQIMRSKADYSLYILKVWPKDTASSGTVSQKYAHVSPCGAFNPREIIPIILSKTKAGIWLVWTWYYFHLCTNLQLLNLLEPQLISTRITKIQIRCLVPSGFFQSPSDPPPCYRFWLFCSHWHESEEFH